MKQMLIKVLKTIFSDVRQAAIPAILLFLVGGSTGILFLSRRALDFVIQTATIPTPLWAAISLVLLCCLYIYLKGHRSHQNKDSLSPLPLKTMLIEAGRFKWKTDIYKSGEFKIYSIPYCKTHEMRLIEYPLVYACQEAQKGCKTIIKKIDLKHQVDIAHSFIEHKLKEK